MKLKKISDQVVVLVGASSGMGRETALRFAQKGASVVVAARDQDGLDSLVQEIDRMGGKAVAKVCDTSFFEQVEAVGDLAIQEFGRIDTWVHLAGTAIYAKFIDTTPEEFRRIVEVNLLGQAYGAMVALSHMREQGGALIQISSVEAVIGTPYMSAYAASKHGVKGFMDVLRMELEHDQVPVSLTNIMPSGINTPFFSHAKTKLGYKPMPYPPAYDPSLVADAILFAAENQTPEMVVGGAGRLMTVLNRHFPRFTHWGLRRTGFRKQITREEKSESAVSGLYAPVRGERRVDGDFTVGSRKWSAHTWMETHPKARVAIKTGLLALAAAGGWGLLQRRTKAWS